MSTQNDKNHDMKFAAASLCWLAGVGALIFGGAFAYSVFMPHAGAAPPDGLAWLVVPVVTAMSLGVWVFCWGLSLALSGSFWRPPFIEKDVDKKADGAAD